ncbi:MAG: hypothetical protein SGARI_003168 [Bacillariaceae sp.]
MAAAIRTALGRLGMSPEAAQAVTEQGMDDIDEFRIMDDNQVETLCKRLSRPGGTTANPDAGAPGQPARIPNPGFAVSMRTEENLKLACFYIRMRDRVSRPVTAADIDLATVRAMTEQRKLEKDHEDPDAPTISGQDWPKNIEKIENHLRRCLGTTGVPLLYVVREDQEVVAHGDDPEDGYDTLEDQQIARAPHFGVPAAGGDPAPLPAYIRDRSKVWDIMSDMSRDTDWWSFVRPGQRRRDGRVGFTGLKSHYLGPNSVDNMAAKAETTLQGTRYSGEGRRWNFEKYVKCHVDQHAILEGLVEHGYAGIDPRSKVRYLLGGITTDKFDTVKTTILGSELYRNSFDDSVRLFKDMMEQTKSLKSSGDGVQISQVSFAGDDMEVDPDMSIQDRYYTKDEYRGLSRAQKLGLKKKREDRGHKPKNHKKSNKSKKSLKSADKAAEKRMISALKAIMKDSKDKKTDDSDDDSEGKDDPVESITNRLHAALLGKKRKQN